MPELRRFLSTTFLDFAPLILIPPVVLASLAGPIVEVWVGESYSSSARLIAFLMVPMALSSSGYLWSAILVATERNLESRWIAAVQAALFWLLVLVLPEVSLDWFVGWKALVLSSTAIFSVARLLAFMGSESRTAIVGILDRTVVGAIVAAILGGLFSHLVSIHRSPSDLILVVATAGCILLLSLSAQVLCSANLRRRMWTGVRGLRP